MFIVVKYISNFVLFLVAMVQLFDFIFTSISIQDFLGTGKTFQWLPQEAYAHLYNKPSPSQTFCYDNEDYHYKDALSKWGYRIMEQVATAPKDYLWASIGYFDSSRSPEMDMCGYFKGHYKNIQPNRARFMSTKEKLTLLKPLVLSDDNIHDTWHSEGTTLAEMDEALEHGYYGSRRGVEIRMTSRLDFANITTKRAEAENGTWPGYYETIKPVKAVRFYGKSFCDGCQPIAELGQMFCELECRVTQAADRDLLNVEVFSSHRRAHSKHRMGVTFPSTNASFYETAIRIGIMLYVAHAMLNILSNSIKSNEERYYLYKRQGADSTVLMSSLVRRPFILEFLSPEQNVCRTQSFSLSFVMYNSDVIVFGNLIVVALTFMQSMQLKHEVVWWAYHHETFRAVITRIGVNAKMMWLYLALIKFYKMLSAKFGNADWTVKMCFNSQLFVWFWVFYLVVMTATGMDFLLDPLFKDRIDIINNFVLLNDISVRFQYGFYFIRIPAICVHSIVVSALALILLIIFQDASGSAKIHNSLFRQMACGHNTLIYDPELFMDDAEKHTSLMQIGSLVNLKWFLKVHVSKLPFIDERYGIYSGENSINFGEDDDMDKGAEAAKASNCTVLNGEDGGLHVISRSTKQDVEGSTMYHEWLQLNKVIRII